jgi:hypothetical protein
LGGKNKLLGLVLLSFVFSLVFTSIDYFVHQNVESISVVPVGYYFNKLGLSVLLFLVLSTVFSNFGVVVKSLLFSASLNYYYYFSTTPVFFVSVFFVHVLILAGMFFVIDKFKVGDFFG